MGVVKLVPVAKALPPVDVANQEIVPAEAVAPNITVPEPILEPGAVLVIVGVGFTVTFVELLTLIKELQLFGEVPPLATFVIVMVVVPEFANVLVVKLPVPALVTVIVEVFPVAVFPPVKL